VRKFTLRRALTFALLTLAAGVAAMSVSPAAANAALGISCPDPATQAFRMWSDPTGWTVSGSAKVVSGNESFDVHSAGDRYSLSLPAGSSVTSPPMCISLLNSKMRFFNRNAGDPGARLKVQVLYNGGVGGLLSTVTKLLGVSDVGYVTAGDAWQPSTPIAMLSGTLPLLTSSVQFRFTPMDSSGAWQIDDVYLDPVMHR
jgi:hypothetical protein